MNVLTPDRRIRVFISSRIQELATERQALVRLITQMGLTPIFFEEIPTPHPPRDQYVAYLQQSEIFLGIYGEGYGWVDVENGMTISGLHDEWNLSEKMPRIVFIKEIDKPRDPNLDKLINEIGLSGVSFKRFKTVKELIGSARAAIAQHVSERYLAVDSESFLAEPNGQIEVAADPPADLVISTNFFSDQLIPTLGKLQRVFVQGSPGIGKTVCLYQIARSDSSAIYISLRNRSALGALTYLIDRIASIGGKPTRHFSSNQEAMQACEVLLRKISVTLLIDDVDQAEDVAIQLAGLAPGISRLVFAGRLTPASFRGNFKSLSCVGFTPQEAAQYVGKAGGTNSIFTETAIERANGNPLYLRYYSESPTQQPAVSLEDYHSAMWQKLSAPEKELLGIIALCEIPIPLELLAHVLGHYRAQTISGIAIQDQVQNLGNLVAVQASRVRIFHPAFRDSVCAKLDEAGLSQPIHQALANAFGARGSSFLRVIHAVRGGLAKTVYDDLIRTANWANVTGRRGAARLILASAIRLGRNKRDWIVAGVALLQSADMKQHTHKVKSALQSTQLAEKVLLRSKSKEATLIARGSKAVFLIEAGHGDEAEVILKELVEHYSKSGLSHIEAMGRVNLSYLYIRRGRMAEVLEQCKKAIATFEVQGDSWGVAVALMNLQNYYIAMYDRENQIKCIKRLMALSKELDSPRLEMAVHNGMTVFYRREKKIDLAERVCLKAITSAKQAGLWDVEATNTGNLGNVYSDSKRYAQARECYERVIQIGIEKGSSHHIAFGKEQLAEIVSKNGDHVQALAIGDEALSLWREVGDAYREASTEDDQGDRYAELNRHFEAGKSYERAAEAWIHAGICDAGASACIKAIEQYVFGRDYREAARCFEAIWNKIASPVYAGSALTLLQALVPVEVQVIILLDLLKIVESLGPLFAEVNNRRLVMDAVVAISAVCKHFRGDFGTKTYLKFLRVLSENCRGAQLDNTIVGLAFGIEQAPEPSVNTTEFEEIVVRAIQGLSDLRYRNDPLVGERWTLILPALNSPTVEVEVVEKVAGVRAAVALTMLLLWSSRHALVKQMGRQKWRRIGFEIMALPVNECKRRGLDIPAYVGEETPCVMANLTNPAETSPPALPLMICDDFLTYADRALRPNNRCSVWVFLQMHDAIIQNFTHFTFPPRKARKARGELLDNLFGLYFKRSESRSEAENEQAEDFF